MPTKSKQINQSSVASKQSRLASDKTLTQESFMTHAMQIMGEGGGYRPTERQVDKILELQEKGMDYTHRERTSVLPRQWFELGIFLIVVISFFSVLFFVANYAPSYLGETITGMLGFLSGGVGGYGVAKARVKKSEE